MSLFAKALSPYSTGTWVFISVLLLTLISINTYVSRITISELNELNKDIALTSTVVATLEETHLSLLKAESGQRGFLLTQDEKYLLHYRQAVSKVKRLFEDPNALTSKVQEQTASIKRLKSLVEQKLLGLEITVMHAQNDRFTQAIREVETDEGRKLYEEIHNLFDQLKTTESDIASAQVNQLQIATRESSRNLTISFVISLLLVVGVFFLAKLNIKSQQLRHEEMEAQNEKLKLAVAERTKELSLFSDELSRSNRELEDFAFVASHDLQEPLRKIRAFGNRLETQSDNLTEKQKDFLSRMSNAASRMSILISDLLEFSRVTTRGRPFQDVDLNMIVKNCIEDLNVLIEESGVTIQAEELPRIIADPTQMQQLIFNLIANAIKFSQNEDKPMVYITIKSVDCPSSIDIEDLSDWLCISVEDNGIGFEQEYADKIFAPFQRLHSREQYKGTGIGLAICRRIVERHNGIIQAFGETGKGAVFTVTIPGNNHLISIKQ